MSPEDVAKIRSKYSDLINYQSDDIDDPIDPLTYRDSGGDGLLHIAAMGGDEETLLLLLQSGADPNSTGDMNSTALHYAASNGHVGSVKVLLEHGAKRDIKDDFGRVPDIANFR